MFEVSVFLKDRLIGRSTFSDDEVRIGRSPDNEIQIDNLALSRYHASIESVEGAYVVKDWQSQNGTFVNGERVQGRRALDDGDRIGFGKFLLVFRTDKHAPEPGAAPAPRDPRNVAAYHVAGQTLVAPAAPEVRSRPCPLVGHLSPEGDPHARANPIALVRDVTVVGSGEGCQVVVPARAGCPPRAAAIVRGWSEFHLVPFGPGVARRGKAELDPAPLVSGDELRFGTAAYRFHAARLEVGP